MITKTKVIRASGFDPWHNLAYEELLLDRAVEGECILYLWQNQNTVVIGKHQNPWKECRTDLLEEEEGKLARRLSGGGAVFHDLGNLNFTFIMKRPDYDLEKQAGTILEAVNSLGIKAEMSGRNDLTIEGRKFSGNAFFFRKDNAYHHGTVLVSADMSKLTRYLQVSGEKIRSKGVESVGSRVVNLNEYRSGLTIEEVADALLGAFGKVYGIKASVEAENALILSGKETLEELYNKYSSWEWRYGKAPQFDIDLETRFGWGGVELGFVLRKGLVEEVKVYSDAMDEEMISHLPDLLKGAEFKSDVLAARLRAFGGTGQRCGQLDDIASWLLEKKY